VVESRPPDWAEVDAYVYRRHSELAILALKDSTCPISTSGIHHTNVITCIYKLHVT